jgi:hypothetical protein
MLYFTRNDEETFIFISNRYLEFRYVLFEFLTFQLPFGLSLLEIINNLQNGNINTISDSYPSDEEDCSNDAH